MAASPDPDSSTTPRHAPRGLCRWLALAAWLLLAGGGAAAEAAPACGGPVPCEVPGGRYLALPPPGEAAGRPRAATLFFHGYRSSAADFAADKAFTDAFAAEGVLLILPDGLNGSWSFHGSPSSARDELAFADAVRRDLIARWQVDPARILVTGFSLGAAMAWELACRRSDDYRAFVAVAGAFWEPLPTRCDGGPVDLLQLHGTADPVVPMTGRAVGAHWHQGDVLASLGLLAAEDGCPTPPVPGSPVPGPSNAATDGTLACEIWSGCADGYRLALCRHPGGHVLPAGWVALAHAWARSLPDHVAGHDGG